MLQAPLHRDTVMDWLFEDPTILIVVIVIAQAILGAFFLSTVKKEFLWGMAGLLVPLAGVLVADYLVVTDREAIELTIRYGVDALEDNDLDRVLTFLSPTAVKTRERATWALGIVKFSSIRISDLKIQVNRLTQPPTAEVRFFAVFRYEFKEPTPEAVHDIYAARFKVLFEKVNDRWLLTDHYEYEVAHL
ncbi:MAG: hypothetical protein ACUVQG_11560 [Thermogutta sp.]